MYVCMYITVSCTWLLVCTHGHLLHACTHARAHTHTPIAIIKLHDCSTNHHRLNILSRKELMINAKRCLIIYHQIIVMELAIIRRLQQQ